MRRLTLGCLGFLVLPMLILLAVGALAAAPPARSSPKLDGPVVLGSWSSTGDMTTPPITVKGSSLRLNVTLDRQLCIRVKQRDGTHVRGECPQQSGTTYFYLTPGTYYLQFSSPFGPWSVLATDLP